MATLFVVGTPIGNLEDIGTRALNVLAEVDMVACEDTRTSKKLLSHYGIETKTISYHAKSDDRKIDDILGQIEEGNSVAYISDAGTPTISDPGSRLVSEAHNRSIPVITIPGPSAVVAALSISGLPASDYLFLGFLPHKKGRKTLMEEIAVTKRTIVFYESPHRFIKALEELSSVLDDTRLVIVARELTKLHEETVRGKAKDVLEHYQNTPDSVRGEVTILVSGAK